MGDVILMGVRLYSPALGRFLQTDPVDGGNATAYDYCAGDPVNCTDLDGRLGWGSIKKGLSKVAKVASYASMIPGPIGTIAGVVSAVSYAATGNWKEAAWAVAGAAAAVVGAGAAVKGARLAVTAVRAASKSGKLAKWGSKARSAGPSIRQYAKRAAGAVRSAGKAAKNYLANGNNYLRIGRHPATGTFRASIGPAYNHYKKLGPVGKALSPIHIHVERRYGGIDFNWFTKKNAKGKKIARNWPWWGK